jgi:hypothetical protein
MEAKLSKHHELGVLFVPKMPKTTADHSSERYHGGASLGLLKQHISQAVVGQALPLSYIRQKILSWKQNSQNTMSSAVLLVPKGRERPQIIQVSGTMGALPSVF